MKKSWLALALVGILIALAGIITLAIVRLNSPLHYVTDTFGVKIPSTVKINSFRTQPDWDGRLSYGTLNAHKGSSTGLVNTVNFTPLKIPQIHVSLSWLKTLIQPFTSLMHSPKVLISFIRK